MAEITEKEVTTSEKPLDKTENPSNPNGSDQSSSNIHYENGKPIYVDPESKAQLEWDESKKEWIPRQSDLSPSSIPNYRVVDGTYVYTDDKSNITYKWNKDKNSWDVVKKEEDKAKDEDSEEEFDDEDEKRKPKDIQRQDMTKGKYGFENDCHTYTDADGTVYIWDKEKNAWFPKVDEDFLARYQMSYGFIAPPEEEKPKEVPVEKPVEVLPPGQKRKPQEPTWFEVDPENNNKVYVSNLPLDITETEFVDVMQKCGLVMKDPESGKMKIKLYTEPGSQQLKGDALCTYIKIESVDLALKILDGYDVRGKKISVERARFTMKGNYDPSLKPKKKRRKDKEKLKKQQEKLFDWRPDKMRGERSRHEKVVIVKNLFEPVIFDKDAGLILEYQQDLREECLKCGDVKRVIIYDRHPEGVAQINFKEAEAADACVQLLNNRWFGQRRITAETWDGKTKYKILETEKEEQERLKGWNAFLQAAEDNKVDVEVKKEDIETADRDSDQETRSSAGSNDKSDEEN